MDNPRRIADCYHRACVADVGALKPGNVSIYSPGHGMQADDFLRSADATRNVMYQCLHSGACGLGESIYLSASATMTDVGCNTNLGIILLCLPLAHAAASCETSDNYLRALERVLYTADISDTQFVFDAVNLMAPAGLGTREEHDVAKPACEKLVTVMESSQHDDLIARQYSNRFEDVLGFGMNSISALRVEPHHLDSEINEVAAGVYMDYLAEYPDTHISRKHGATMAEAVRDEARKKRNLLSTINSPEDKQQTLLEFDQVLKSRGINPGTSADLTVAAIFAALLENTLPVKIRNESGTAKSVGASEHFNQ